MHICNIAFTRTLWPTFLWDESYLLWAEVLVKVIEVQGAIH